jgi:hypothetical protein
MLSEKSEAKRHPSDSNIKIDFKETGLKREK